MPIRKPSFTFEVIMAFAMLHLTLAYNRVVHSENRLCRIWATLKGKNKTRNAKIHSKRTSMQAGAVAGVNQ
jgi:hypothetical protein